MFDRSRISKYIISFLLFLLVFTGISLTISCATVNVQLPTAIATATTIWADFTITPSAHLISVRLKPTSIAIADKEYAADLYDKGVFRERVFVSWDQTELNVLEEKVISFSSNLQEYETYRCKNISYIFSVKVHE